MNSTQVGYAANLLVIVAFVIKLLNLHLNVTADEIVGAIVALVILIGSIVSLVAHVKQGGLTMLGAKKPDQMS